MLARIQSLQLGFLWLFAAVQLGAQTPLSFAPPTSIHSPVKPSMVHAVDLNLDGLTDLVTVNTATSTVSLFRRLPAGGFDIAEVLDVDSAPQAVTSADFDNDGDIDLVTANTGGPTITLLLNDGPLGYARVDILTPGALPFIAAFDVDFDFDIDIVLGGGVFLQNFNGGFAPAVSLSLGVVGQLVPTDVDADGDADLVAVVPQTGPGVFPPISGIFIFENDGTGFFAPRLPVFYSGRAIDWVLTDLNNDGDFDLVVVNDALTENISVFSNNGTGTFQQTGQFTLSFFPSGGFVFPRSILAADLDSDADRDIIVPFYSAISNSAGLAFFRNNGLGGFVPGPLGGGATLTLSPSSDPSIHATMADLNADAVPDIAYVSTSPASNDICLLINTTTQSTMPPPVILNVLFGDQQTTVVGRPFVQPMILQATSSGVPVAGFPITVTPMGGDSLIQGSGTYVTDLFGRISVSMLAGSTGGVRTPTFSGPTAVPVSLNLFARKHEVIWTPASGHFTVSFQNDKAGVPLLFAFDLSPAPPPVIQTSYGPIHVGILAPNPYLAVLDGLGVFGPADFSLVATPNFTRTYVLPASLLGGLPLTSQVFGIDFSEPFPFNIITSNPQSIVF